MTSRVHTHSIIQINCQRNTHAGHAPPAQVLPLYRLSRNCSALDALDTRVMAQLSCLLSRGLGLPELRCVDFVPHR